MFLAVQKVLHHPALSLASAVLAAVSFATLARLAPPLKAPPTPPRSPPTSSRIHAPSSTASPAFMNYPTARGRCTAAIWRMAKTSTSTSPAGRRSRYRAKRPTMPPGSGRPIPSRDARRIRPDRRAHLVPVSCQRQRPMPEILYFNGRRVALGDDLEPVVLFDNAKPGEKVTVAVKLLHTVDTKTIRGATLKIDFPESRPNPEDLRIEFLSAAVLVPTLAPNDASQMATLNGAITAVDIKALDAHDQAAFDASLKAAHSKLEALLPLMQTATLASDRQLAHRCRVAVAVDGNR